MFGIIAVVAGILPIVAVAQYGPPPQASPTSAVMGTVPSAPPNTPGQINVDVAFQETFTFHPSNFSAPNGTQVTFYFPNNGLDHSVTQSSFAEPCTYLAATGNSSTGFDSELQSAVTFSITIIDDSQPIWFHCKQVLHCGMGMVGAINAPVTGNTFDAFLAAAKKIGNLEVTETGGPVTGGVAGIATALPTPDISSATFSTPSSTGGVSISPSFNIAGASSSPSPNVSGANSTSSSNTGGASSSSPNAGLANSPFLPLVTLLAGFLTFILFFG